MSNKCNVKTNPAVKRKRRNIVLEGSSSEDDSAVKIPNTSHSVIYIQESESIQSGNDNNSSQGKSADNEEPPNTEPSSSKTVKTNDDGFSSDSSDGQFEKCPICLVLFKNQEVGSLEACDHNFCADCIKVWAKTVNTCPVDRKKFDQILVRNNYNGAYVRSLPVQERTDNAPEAEIDLTSCQICGLSNNEDRLLLCVKCNCACHLECFSLVLPYHISEVPAGEWICPFCREQDYNLLDEQDEQD